MIAPILRTLLVAGLVPIACCARVARAGIDPTQVLVIINDNDPDSIATGRHFADRHGIPDSLRFHARLPVADTIPVTTFAQDLAAPMHAYLSDTGLEPQIRQVALCWKRPFRVQLSGDNINSIASALFYGYHDAPPPLPCALNPLAANPLFARARRFMPTEHAARLYPAFLVTAGSVAATTAMVDRAAFATATQPTGTVHLLRTFDLFRNVQWPQFERAEALGRFSGAPVTWNVADASSFSNLVNVAGVMAGAESHQPYLGTNQFVPGALGDHLTSYGGVLSGFPPQMAATDWLAAGCAAAWGAVIEPCNYTNKFPTAELHAWYQRGFTAGEAYAMAVSHPYQGQAMGDPLCAPYAHPVGVSLFGFPSTGVVTGLVSATATATSSVPGRRVDRMEWYLDDRLVGVSPPVMPTPGNLLTASLGGTNHVYEIREGDDLFAATAGLAAVIESAPEWRAEAIGDAVLVRQAAWGMPGAALSSSAAASHGWATGLTVAVRSALPAVSENRHRARTPIYVQGDPVAGSSTLRLDLTRLDGTPVAQQAVALPGETRYAWMLRLMQAVEADPAFQHPEGALTTYIADYPAVSLTVGYLFSRDQTWRAPNVQYRWRVSGAGPAAVDLSGRLEENADVLAGRAVFFVEAGEAALTRTFPCDTTTLADGPHRLRAVGVEGTAVATTGAAELTFLVDNHDGDCVLMHPAPGSWFLEGTVVTADVQVAGAAPVAEMRGWVEGRDTGTGIVWDTASTGPGRLRFQVRAIDTLARASWSERVEVLVLADADRDQMADDWEARYWGNLTGVSSADSDADGVDNQAEFLAGTNPLLASSRFVLSAERLSAGRVRLHYPAALDRRFLIEVCDDGAAGTWSPVPSSAGQGIGGEQEWTDTSPPAGRWYRVRASLP